ncbi:hypothetical protein HZP56_00675 [Elizabethkingia anophelis]|uniref:hypothetical protein n=1 Tax=Elizabethkingia anophelis TaxID=1117645 RepID=UPI0020B2DBD6|nr:hypothetical protein [Elizabethkingia anophelis]MCT3721809.1 hypothetical protein [Elizabethkingia anophelis]MCT3725368.1 hypothetical protein [Elizabethkingia anophelis]MCT3778491.1 hypothetical protein [Elizabethkingia anophelis]MCT3785612.1 hypothetical protein [Elizabethkingia anophelis]MCT3792838.1 hypothetical protein [Elizabethkingia anophelis]
MNELFEVSEIDTDDSILKKFPNLNLNKNAGAPAYYTILRGLIGELKIKQVFRDEEFIQDINYLNPYSENRYIELTLDDSPSTDIEATDKKEDDEKTPVDELLKGELRELVGYLKSKTRLSKIEKHFGKEYSLEDLSSLLENRVINNRNKEFYNNLLNEYLNFYYYTHKRNHALAFLHLYRILEYTSYTFPLLYAISTKDFSNSYSSLRTLFTGDKDKGELKVFKDFIGAIYGEDRYYGRISIDIDILSDLPEYNERIYKTILNICDSEIFDMSKNSENHKIAIKFTQFSSFIITIRNRFFHLKNSQSNNIHSIDIVDANHFFSLINKKCAYFIGLLTFEVIKKSCLVK